MEKLELKAPTAPKTLDEKIKDAPIQTKYLKISNIHRLYTRLYTAYRRFFYFISKHFKISTLQILTIKVHIINVY